MSTLDRFLLSILVLLVTALALREGDYLSRRAVLRPEIVVSVSGAVRLPGVISLPAGSRAVHAVELCGGLSSQADLERLELARSLQDGEHLVIERRAEPAGDLNSGLDPLGETSGPTVAEMGEAPSGVRPPAARAQEAMAVVGSLRRSSSGRTRRSEPGDGPLNLNQATEAELERLPGVGPVMARRILQARQASPSGTFNSLEELRAIRGIKGKTLERLKPHLKIEGS